MKLQEAIDKCDKFKPNQYDEETKVEWINELEQRIVDEIITRHEGFEDFAFQPYQPGEEAALLVQEPYSSLYIKFLFSQIDLYNSELDRYNNSATLFNYAYADYQAWYRRNHMPIQSPFTVTTSLKEQNKVNLSIQRVGTTAGVEVTVKFERLGNKFIVKNFTQANIYAGFSTPVSKDTSVLIRPDTFQTVMIGERFDYEKTAANTLYILPEADSSQEEGVEVQLIVV